MNKPRTFDFDQLMEEIKEALMDMDGDQVALVYNQLIDPEIRYTGDLAWEEVESREAWEARIH